MFKRIENYSDFPTPTQIGIFNLFSNGSFMSFLITCTSLDHNIYYIHTYIYTQHKYIHTHTTV